MNKTIHISNKRVLVISDIHLGDKTGSDDFAYSDFRRLKNQEDKIIDWICDQQPNIILLNGDIKELWQHSDKTVNRIYARLLSGLKKLGAVYVRGNHDYTASRISSVVLRYANLSILVEHGHESDPKMHSTVTKVAVFLLSLVEKIIPWVDNYFIRIMKKKDNEIELKLDRYAQEKLKSYDYVVFGHSHIQKQEGSYFNCGTCQEGNLQGVLIENGVPRLVRG